MAYKSNVLKSFIPAVFKKEYKLLEDIKLSDIFNVYQSKSGDIILYAKNNVSIISNNDISLLSEKDVIILSGSGIKGEPGNGDIHLNPKINSFNETDNNSDTEPKNFVISSLKKLFLKK